MAPGVVPLVGVTVSHGAFETDTVNGSAAPLLPTCTVWEAGAASPVLYVKVVLFVSKVSAGGEVTFAVTLTVCGLPEAPEAVMVTVPVCVPWLSKAVLRLMLRVDGVLP